MLLFRPLTTTFVMITQIIYLLPAKTTLSSYTKREPSLLEVILVVFPP